MNHGFTVDGGTLPAAVQETHVSSSTVQMRDRAEGPAVFSVLHQLEASPGPTDSRYRFGRSAGPMDVQAGWAEMKSS